jgi:hypothetical protein
VAIPQNQYLTFGLMINEPMELGMGHFNTEIDYKLVTNSIWSVIRAASIINKGKLRTFWDGSEKCNVQKICA